VDKKHEEQQLIHLQIYVSELKVLFRFELEKKNLSSCLWKINNADKKQCVGSGSGIICRIRIRNSKFGSRSGSGKDLVVKFRQKAEFFT